MATHPAVRIALWVIALYVVYGCAGFLLQRRMVFPRYLAHAPTEAPALPPGGEILSVRTRAGDVEAWFLPPGSGPTQERSPAAVFAHGNAELIDIWPETLRGLTRLGVAVLLVEYPGYGRSEGSPSERTIADALSAGYDALVARPEVDPDRIVLIGRSLGGGAICTLAKRRPSAALVLMSTFTSIRAMAWRQLLPGFLVRDPFDNLSVVSEYPGPILIIHGAADRVIPYAHGLSLDRAAANSRMLTYRCGHNDCPPNWPAFWIEMEAFLRQSGVLPSPETQ